MKEKVLCVDQDSIPQTIYPKRIKAYSPRFQPVQIKKIYLAPRSVVPIPCNSIPKKRKIELNPYRHDFQGLDDYFKKFDEIQGREFQCVIEFWTPKILYVKRRLKRCPNEFAHEIRVCERMEKYLAKWKFFPESYQKLLAIYRDMTK